MFQVVSIAQSRGHSKPMKCVTAGVVFSAGRGYHVSLSEGKVVSERNLLRVLGIGALIQGQTTANSGTDYEFLFSSSVGFGLRPRFWGLRGRSRRRSKRRMNRAEPHGLPTWVLRRRRST